MKSRLFSIFLLLAASSAGAIPVQYTIFNSSGSTVTYNGQAILNGASFQVPAAQISAFSNDPALRSDLDIEKGVYLSDGTNTFAGDKAIQYLRSQNTQALLNDSNGSAVTLGQKVMASSLPVVVASDNGLATSANQATTNTSIQILDDVPTAANGAFSKGSPSMGQLDDASVTAATEDNLMPARITAQRAWHANLRNNAGTEVGTSGAPLRVDPTGTTSQPVAGDVASAATDSGNPVKISGVYRSTAPAFTNGQRGDLQIDAFGSLATTAGVTRLYRHQAAAATVTLKSGAGRLISVCLNTNVANGHTITIWDNTAASTTVIATITTSGAWGPGCAAYDLYFTTGLTFTTSNNDDWTIVYQ